MCWSSSRGSGVTGKEKVKGGVPIFGLVGWLDDESFHWVKECRESLDFRGKRNNISGGKDNLIFAIWGLIFLLDIQGKKPLALGCLIWGSL